MAYFWDELAGGTAVGGVIGISVAYPVGAMKSNVRDAAAAALPRGCAPHFNECGVVVAKTE